MSATIVSLSDYAARFVRRPESEEQIVARRVREQLHGKGLTASRIAQAEARAERAIKTAGVSLDRAVRRAVAWATDADDHNNPPPRAA